LNIQTERLEDHTARLTVEIEATRFEKAKQQAARNISRKVNIPGFRKGKAPYRILANFVGEEAIVAEAVEQLGEDVYKSVLKESDVEVYGTAELEDFTLEPLPTFKFRVPLQPSIDLNDYRSVRLDYEEPVITDEDVDNAINSLLEQHAVIEDSQGPVQIGHRVTVDIHGVFVDEEQPDEDDADEDHEAHDHEHDDVIDERLHEAPNYLLHRHDMQIILEADREIAPGFAKAMEGATLGELRTFELTYPDDDEEHGELAGRTVRFDVVVKKIENRTLPVLNDDFAARVTEQEDQPLTLLQLRMRIRENLEAAAEMDARSEYAWKVVDKIAEQATISYPEELVKDESNRLIDNAMRRMNISRDDYLRLTQQTEDDLLEQFHEPAIRSIQRGLVLREIIEREGIEITEDQLEKEIANFVVAQFGEEQAASFRTLFEDKAMRETMRTDLLQERVLDHIVAIAKGEAAQPQLTLEEEDEENEDENQVSIESEESEPVEDAEADTQGESE